MTTLTVSIVTYRSDGAVLRETLQSLHVAVASAKDAGLLADAAVILVDNGPDRDSYETVARLVEEANRWPGAIATDIVTGHGNIGFGKGHNSTLR